MAKIATMRSLALILCIICISTPASDAFRHELYTGSGSRRPVGLLTKNILFKRHPSQFNAPVNPLALNRLHAVRNMNLDRPVIPKSAPLLQTIGLAAMAVYVLWKVVQTSAIQALLSKFSAKISEQRAGSKSRGSIVREWVERMREVAAGLWEKVRGLVSGERESEVEDEAAWRPCTFEKVEELNGKYRKYSFSVGERDRKRLLLAPGQKITLCTLTEKGAYVKTSYFGRRAPQGGRAFEVFAPRYHSPTLPRSASVLNYLNTEAENQKKEVVAFRKGEVTLDYKGRETIRSLSLVASGLGVVPVASLLQTMFARSDDLAIDECTLLWINENKDDYILDDEVQEMEEKNEELFQCLRIEDAGINVEDTELNEGLKGILANYTTGRVAVIAGSLAVAEKFIPCFEALQYPADNIIYIPVM